MVQPLVISLLFVVFANGLFAQSSQTVDTNYIRPHINNAAIGILTTTPELTVTVTPKPERGPNANNDENIKSTATYSANLRQMIGFMAMYRNFYLEVNIPRPISEQNTENFGRSSSSDLTLRVKLFRMLFESSYRRITGFYDANTPNNVSDWEEGMPLVKRSDIVLTNFKTKMLYFAHPERFSYRGAFTFQERQMRSAGTFGFLTHTNYLRLYADSNFVGHFDQQLLTPAMKSNDIELYSLGVAPGYAHNFKFFKNQMNLSFAAFLGLDGQFQINRSQIIRRERFAVAPLFDLRFSVGYSSDRFFAGIVGVSDFSFFNFSELNANANMYIGKLILGYRFNNKAVDRVYDKTLKRLKYLLPLSIEHRSNG